MNQRRPNLPPLTPRIAALPIDERGYPVPYFVQWLHPDGSPAKRGLGKPDHRVMDSTAFMDCVMNGKCWVCGQSMGRIGVFVIGPMCAVNHNTAEPPSHQDCARWSVMGCPFLSNPDMVRREAGMPEGVVDAAGFMIRRNPGVMALWSSRTWKPYAAPGGFLMDTGDPISVEWWCRGQLATRQQVIDAITSGCPILKGVCRSPEDIAAVDTAVEKAMALVPAA